MGSRFLLWAVKMVSRTRIIVTILQNDYNRLVVCDILGPIKTKHVIVSEWKILREMNQDELFVRPLIMDSSASSSGICFV